MKTWILCFWGLTAFFGCASGQGARTSDFARLPELKKGEKVATFAGGCFWSLSEGFSELNGVHQVVSGYSGGTVKNPSYEDVCTKSTGHAESVQVYYDPSLISYAQLAEAFFYAHDPTTRDRQGPDEGPDYRSLAFYRTPEEKKSLLQVVEKVNLSHHYSSPVVTDIIPFQVIYPAETYHQGYYRLHPDNPYIRNVSVPKVMKLRKAMRSQLKPAFKDKPEG